MQARCVRRIVWCCHIFCCSYRITTLNDKGCALAPLRGYPHPAGNNCISFQDRFALTGRAVFLCSYLPARSAEMSDQRERQSRAERHVRLNAQADGPGLGACPNKHIGNGKGYPDDLLAGFKQNTIRKLGMRCPAFLLQSTSNTKNQRRSQ